MTKIVINTNNKQPDGKYKISSNATFDDGTYYGGHVLVSEADFMNMTGKEYKKITCQTLIKNLENELKELEM